MPARLKTWFYRATAVHFLLTAVTAVLLYLRPGGNRPGWYSEEVKEVLVMLHNGEWLTGLALGRPFWSGIVLGTLMAVVLAQFSWRALIRAPAPAEAPPALAPRPRTLWLLGGAALGLGAFLLITHRVLHAAVDALDERALVWMAGHRAAALNLAALEVTALGSVTVLALATFASAALLWRARDKAGAAQVVLAAVGAALLTEAVKAVVERPRPSAVPPLVEVTGFAYPSGHSLSTAAVALTLALLAFRHIRSARAQTLAIALGAALVVLVGLSRVYLGVHAPSDVLAGWLLGAAWALGLAALAGRLFARARGG